MPTTTIKVKGMHCKSCELLLEDVLKDIKGINKVSANFRKKELTIYHKENLPLKEIETAIQKSGYEIGEEQKHSWFVSDSKTIEELIIATSIAIFLYIIFKRIGLFEYNISSTADSLGGNAAILLVGLTAGFSTCMALIGGLVLGLSAKHNEKHPESSTAQKFRPHIFFNIGRITSFFILGGILSLIGKAIQLSSTSIGVLVLIVAVIMLLMGTQLTGLSPKISNIKLTLPSKLAKLLKINQRHEKEYSHKNAFVLGALTFFLPCGFTQAIQIYAISTGSFLQGSIVMGLFALGTLPGLLGIGFVSSILKGTVGRIFFKFTGVVVIAFAIINFQSGMNLTGLASPKLPTETSQQSSQEGDVQVVKMTQKVNGYVPNQFTVKKGIPVRWEIFSETTYSCASSVVIPELKIGKYLEYGPNIIEFTPKEEGTIRFMCSMGMFTGQFIVTN